MTFAHSELPRCHWHANSESLISGSFRPLVAAAHSSRNSVYSVSSVRKTEYVTGLMEEASSSGSGAGSSGAGSSGSGKTGRATLR